MASGYVPSNSGDQIYFYSSGQAFTHGGDAATHSWGNNSGIRRLTARKDGFVAVEAPYLFNEDISRLPSLTTVKVKVPSTCPPPQVTRPLANGSARWAACSRWLRCAADTLAADATAPGRDWVLLRVSRRQVPKSVADRVVQSRQRLQTAGVRQSLHVPRQSVDLPRRHLRVRPRLGALLGPQASGRRQRDSDEWRSAALRQHGDISGRFRCDRGAGHAWLHPGSRRPTQGERDGRGRELGWRHARVAVEPRRAGSDAACDLDGCETVLAAAGLRGRRLSIRSADSLCQNGSSACAWRQMSDARLSRRRGRRSAGPAAEAAPAPPSGAAPRHALRAPTSSPPRRKSALSCRAQPLLGCILGAFCPRFDRSPSTPTLPNAGPTDAPSTAESRHPRPTTHHQPYP